MAIMFLQQMVKIYLAEIIFYNLAVHYGKGSTRAPVNEKGNQNTFFQFLIPKTILSGSLLSLDYC